LTLINNLLDLSKIEAGHVELEQIDFDLEDIVHRTVELMDAKARAKGVALLCRIAPDVHTSLIGDPGRLQQILVNLIGNAVKFTDRGEIVVTVQAQESRGPGYIDVSVADSGIGIPPEMCETIFGDFIQADASTTRRYGGSGLGLGICRRLVTQMGGALTVTSIPGEGSTFRFTAVFGAGMQSPSPSSQGTEAIVADFCGRRVLVINNNPTERLFLRETLHAWGLEIDESSLLEEALSRVAQAMADVRPYALVLFDSCMPIMDSFEAVGRIQKISPELPVVMLTSYAQPGHAGGVNGIGLGGYAVKPVKRADLLRVIGDAMKGRRPPAAEIEDASKKRCGTKRLRILFAEDSPDNRFLMQTYLKGSLHELTFAEDGEDAIDQFRAGSFDLVLMDMHMPVVDGLTATRAIRVLEQNQGLAPIPIVALTANACPKDAETCRTAGCSAYLSKPISKARLLSALEEYGPRQA
jgi:CheY-like chemotaxis protein